MYEEISFGKWLSNQRKSLGLTQKQLAVMVNCATITLRKIEAEQRRPSAQLVKRLAQILEIPAEEHGAFLRFARQDDPSKSFMTKKNYPWQSLAVSLNTNFLTSLLSPIMNGHINSSEDVVFLDENIHRINQILHSSGFNNTASPLPITHAKMPHSQDSTYFILLVPIEIPTQLADILIENHSRD